ncbi:hypothetical protein Mkiyose1088_46550 [Mycobacterium kiyosense]|nr:hypothetical protein MKCMC460_59950 [Mycobacterium sp. 20KCMC460]GLB92676.1 hypothetical protein SRL2020130_54930 [Mycobacterium kiyosense]GLC04829.1 hypothetical protein SRL2020400_54200 [Mycobacterium kiyosense]GLC10611.1 hypothetical protein SRL2020411_52570 [Mycobacterium kiyosense]GLC16574.1 hypothetical protein SRL2020448_51770 [Mycobacterium kiyosense]
MWVRLPLFGIPPWMVFARFSINLIYQFWVHTIKATQASPARPGSQCVGSVAGLCTP